MKILVLYYSQTGQTEKALQAFMAPFMEEMAYEVTFARIVPKRPFPFPWPFFEFFGIMPETVLGVPIEIEPLPVSPKEKFDLIVLGYQPWFLSPSLPVSSILQSPWKALFRDTPVMTIITCRNMWIEADRVVTRTLEQLDARLVGKIVITDPGPSYATFVTTPMWMLTGKRKFRNPLLDRYFPEAGIPEKDLEGAVRFGRALAAKIDRIETVTSEECFEEETARIIDRLRRAERAGKRVFRVWARLIRAVSRPGTLLRSVMVFLFVIYLCLAILIGMPIVSLINRFLPRSPHRDEVASAVGIEETPPSDSTAVPSSKSVTS
ncbi:MAG: hypothetical protein D6812_17935 [Deltaproteobacteria bacterium]|nr:MAG: hypothetical protein D6812_17935 [Deltaproteobacteria bacterium]